MIILILILSLIVNTCFLFRIINLSRENSFLSQINLQYQNTNKQNNLRLQQIFASPTPKPIYNGSKVNIIDFGFNLTCINNETCTYTIQDVSSYGETKKGYSINISNRVGVTVNKLDLATLNNPNYNSVIDWFNGLLYKNPKAFGSNLNINYGIKYIPGTDGYFSPFYENYDVNSITPVLYGDNLGLFVQSKPGFAFVDFYIPNGQILYKFTLGTIDKSQIDLINGLLKTISFN